MLTTETVPITALTLDPENARTHSQRNLDSIKASLKSFGQRKPIVVYRDTVIAGNGTLMAAKELGWKDISIVRAPDDWDEQKVKAFALADNRTSELASWDEEMLLVTLNQLSDGLLEATGFTDMDIRALEAIYGEIPEGFEGRAKDPSDKPEGKLISLHVDEDTADRWKAVWDALDGDDSARLNAIMDVMP